MSIEMESRKKFVCVNCGQGIKQLYKKYSNTLKTVNCDHCLKVADKYIEFETVIIIVDSMLLSQQVYRHALYNRDFKLFWKLSLMLLLLESLTLWRETKEDKIQFKGEIMQSMVSQEHGFYFCCIHKISDFILCTLLLVIVTFALRPKLITHVGLRAYSCHVLKANTIANFSKFFLLPIMLWRENTTDFGAALHRTFVTGHHLFALIFVYMVVSRFRAVQAALVVLPIYATKEIVMQYLLKFIERNNS